MFFIINQLRVLLYTKPKDISPEVSFYYTRKDGEKMTSRMKKFSEYYAQCGNTVQSAIKAGYSAKYANSDACKILENPRVAEYIKELSQKAQNERILTAKERQAMLSDIAKDEENSTSDRIRAVDTLNKMTGEYTTKIQADMNANVNNPFAALSTDELKKLIDNG